MTEELQSPFLEKQVECPVCRRPGTQRSFRSRMFAAEERESDQHVASYRWLNDGAKRAHPPHYFVWLCSHCHYADIAEEYANPTDNPFHARIAKAFKEIGRDDKIVVEVLARHAKTEDIDYRSALNLHLLATFIQTMLPSETRDAYKIGRLMLRVAWLYRENRPDESGRKQIRSVDEIQSAKHAWDNAFQSVQTAWQTMGTAINRRALELDDDFKKENKVNPYSAVQQTIEDNLKGLSTSLFRLKTLTEKDYAGVLLGESDIEQEPFFRFSSYSVFFEKLKELWPYAPSDEIEAMRSAITNFEHGASTDPRFDDPEKHFSVVSLITDLMIRCDDIDGAFGMIRGIYKAACDQRARLTKEAQNKEIDDRQRRLIKGKIERAAVGLRQAADLRHKLLDLLLERDLPKIKEIVARTAGQDPAVVERTLVEEGIQEGLIARLKEKGGLLEHLVPKKGLFR